MSAPPLPLVSIVCPAKNEARNLEDLYRRIEKALQGETWELIVVDDHSADDTFSLVRRLASTDRRVRGVRLSRGFGSHVAILCGLRRAAGQCAVVMAADLQDPPELIPELLRLWKEGAQVVTTVRAARPGERAPTRFFSHLYVWLVRHFGGVPELDPGAGTFLLADRRAIDALALYHENNLSLHVLIAWIGFRRASLEYVQEPRLHGSSNWTLARKLGLMRDSLMAHSFLLGPTLTVMGALAMLAGIGCGVWLAGWGGLRSSADGRLIAALVLALGGLQILVMGILGEYVWRALSEARRRPQYLVEETTACDDDKSFGAVYP